jgi:Tfp pilus assembly protein PilN
MDQHKLRNLVFEKTGVKIDVDDPVFALVALNEAVLEEAVERHVALLNEASDELAGQLAALPGRPVAAPAVQVAPERRMMLVAGGAAVLGAVLVLAGQALFFRPGPVPAPVLQAKELTAEQSAAIRDGEKLARAVAKLDRKTRSAIEAEMQKP